MGNRRLETSRQVSRNVARQGCVCEARRSRLAISYILIHPTERIDIDKFDNMHLPTAVGKQHPAVYVAVFLAFLIPLYCLSWQFHAAHPWLTPSYRAKRPPSLDFVGDWLDVHLVEPFNPSDISAYCNTSEWRPNLVFRLDKVNGSIGDIRGNLVDFLFFAIEAGASIVLPDLSFRNQKVDSDEEFDPVLFDSLFDGEWLLKAMSEACPQVAIYRSPDVDTLPKALPAKYIPNSRRVDLLPTYSRTAYSEHLDDWLKSQPAYNSEQVSLVNIEISSSVWEIDTRSLPPFFRRSFPQLIRINPSLRRLAALAVQNLAIQHPAIAFDPRDAIPYAAFCGIYLDIPAERPNDTLPHSLNANFTAQTDAYIAHALSRDMQLIYAASSNGSTLALFREKAAQHTPALSVITKADLIPPEALEEFEGLTWDQKSLVDYEVLLRCSYFAGFVNSTLAFNVAVTRAQRREDEAVAIDPWRVKHLDRGVVFEDGISRIVGRDEWREERVPRGMWP